MTGRTRTPEERRAKYPIGPIEPMTDDELEALRQRVDEWLARPAHSSRLLDITYRTQARLLATIDRLRLEALLDDDR